MRSNTVKTELYWLVRLGQIIVAIFSWVATTYGILAWDSDKNINLDTIMNPSSIGVIAFVAAITIFTILLLNFSLQQRKFINKIILGIFYLVFAFISIGFGYGYWWNKLESTDKITYSLEEDIDRANMKMADVKSHLDGVTFVLSELEQSSKIKQDIEDERGGSCENQRPPIEKGKGPFYNARIGISESIEELSKDTTVMNNSVSLLYSELMELILENKKIMKKNLSQNIDISISVKLFRQKYNRKILYFRNSKFDYVLTKVTDKISILQNALKKDGKFIRPKSKVVETIRHCQDLKMHKEVDNLSKKINNVISSINNSQIKFESENKSGRIRMALLGVSNKILPESLEVDKNKTYPISAFPLGLSVLFDFLLLFFTVVLYKWTKQRKYYPNLKLKVLQEFGNDNQHLSIELREVFNKYVFKVENKSYLVYPTLKYINENSFNISINHFMMIITKLKHIQSDSYKLINQEKTHNIDIVNFAEGVLTNNGWVKEGSNSKMEILSVDYPFLLDVVEILNKHYVEDDLNTQKDSKKTNIKKVVRPTKPKNRKY